LQLRIQPRFEVFQEVVIGHGLSSLGIYRLRQTTETKSPWPRSKEQSTRATGAISRIVVHAAALQGSGDFLELFDLQDAIAFVVPVIHAGVSGVFDLRGCSGGQEARQS
jgi:hypothetical protein